MLTLWTVERTGGNCTADVSVPITCDRTGIPYVVVVTADEGHAFSTAALDVPGRHASILVNVYTAEAWDVTSDLPNASAEASLGHWVWDEADADGPPLTHDDVWVAASVDFHALLASALADAGLHLESTDPETGISTESRLLASALMASAGLWESA